MKKYTNRIKLMPKFTKCMSLAMILTFTSYEEAFAEMSYAEQTSFTVSMENQTLKSVINWVEKNSQFIFIYRTDIDLSRRVNVDVRNTPIRDKIAISCMLRQIHESSSHAIRHGLYIKNRKRLFCP